MDAGTWDFLLRSGSTLIVRASARFLSAALPALLLAFFLTGCDRFDKLDQLRNGATEKNVKTTAPPEMQADANSSLPAISADGRFVAFRSDATNLVIGTTNGATGIFVKEIQTGKTMRVSTGSDGAQGNRDSSNPAISADGRFVAFDSASSNLVPDDNNQCFLASGTTINCVDVFLKDMETGLTTRVSTGAAGGQGARESSEPAISAAGRFVAFRSGAPNLVPEDTNGKMDIFVKDTQAGAISRVSTDVDGTEGDDDSNHTSISADGRLVAFSSAAGNLVPGDTNGKPDVFIKDRTSGAINRVSTAADGKQGNDTSGFSALAISADGRYVAFESAADDLVADDTNGKLDVFVKDTQSGAIVRVSTGAGGEEGLEDSYSSVAISADGRWVSFRSDSPNLVPGDTNARPDIFVKDLHGGAIVRVSTGSAGAQGTDVSEFCAISADGGFVAFESASPNLIAGDSNNKKDIFRKDTRSGTTIRVSTSTSEVL